MSTDPADPAQAADERSRASENVGGANDPRAQPNEEDRSEAGRRAAYEAELSRVTSADMILQAAVSLLNIGSYRLGLAPGQEQQGGSARDLEQVRDAIDGVRALLVILERRQSGELRPLRDALSQLQLAYAREAGTTPTPPADPATTKASPTTAKQTPSAAPGKPSGPGPAESSGRLWVPGR